VAAAAVVTVAAYLDATAAPTRSFVVATAPIEPGTRLGSMAEVSERFGTIALDLADEVAARVVPASAVDGLVGQVVVAPLEPGDLLTRTQLVDDGGVDGAQTLSFALPRTAAVAGALRPGERVDVLATFGSGAGAYTAYVVRGVPLLGVSAPDGGPLGGSSELTLTVAVSELRDVQALGHAVNTAEVFVTRSTAHPEVDEPAPGAYQPAPEDVGPRPDPAGPTTAGGGGSSAVEAPRPEEAADPDTDPDADPEAAPDAAPDAGRPAGGA
jgi:pilus assembly protein CpaB